MKHSRPVIGAFVASMLLGAVAWAASPAGAGPGNQAEQWFIGAGPAHGPDIAVAPNGDTVELTGQGTLNFDGKTVTGGGTFTHKDPAGNVLVSGTWTATTLVTFRSFGDGAPQGAPGADGGKAIFKVHLSVGVDGTIEFDCLLGRPPAGAVEGATLKVPGVINFNKKAGGETVFIPL